MKDEAHLPPTCSIASCCLSPIYFAQPRSTCRQELSRSYELLSPRLVGRKEKQEDFEFHVGIGLKVAGPFLREGTMVGTSQDSILLNSLLHSVVFGNILL